MWKVLFVFSKKIKELSDDAILPERKLADGEGLPGL